MNFVFLLQNQKQRSETVRSRRNDTRTYSQLVHWYSARLNSSSIALQYVSSSVHWNGLPVRHFCRGSARRSSCTLRQLVRRLPARQLFGLLVQLPPSSSSASVLQTSCSVLPSSLRTSTLLHVETACSPSFSTSVLRSSCSALPSWFGASALLGTVSVTVI